MKATEETKQAAKDAGIKSWHLKSEEKLQEELGGLTETVSVEAEEPVIETVTEEVAIDKLPDEVDLKLAIFSIKVLHTKSPYWKYKDLL